jgi:hypothetical protein
MQRCTVLRPSNWRKFSGTIDLDHATLYKKSAGGIFLRLVGCISSLSPDILFLSLWYRSIVPEIQRVCGAGMPKSAAHPGHPTTSTPSIRRVLNAHAVDSRNHSFDVLGDAPSDAHRGGGPSSLPSLPSPARPAGQQRRHGAVQDAGDAIHDGTACPGDAGHGSSSSKHMGELHGQRSNTQQHTAASLDKPGTSCATGCDGLQRSTRLMRS